MPIPSNSRSLRLLAGHRGMLCLGCSNRAAGNPGRTDRDPWRPHSRIGHIEDKAAGQCMDRRRRHSFDLNWRDCRSAQVWRACRSSRKKSWSFIRMARISGTWGAWSREIRNELNRQSPWPLDIQEYSLVTARNGDAAAEAKFVEYLDGALRSTTARFDRRFGCARGSFRPATQGRPVSDNADAARGGRSAPG